MPQIQFGWYPRQESNLGTWFRNSREPLSGRAIGGCFVSVRAPVVMPADGLCRDVRRQFVGRSRPPAELDPGSVFDGPTVIRAPSRNHCQSTVPLSPEGECWNDSPSGTEAMTVAARHAPAAAVPKMTRVPGENSGENCMRTSSPHAKLFTAVFIRPGVAQVRSESGNRALSPPG